MILTRISRRLFATATAPSTTTSESKWAISVGVALIRAPVIAPEMTDVERKFAECQASIEHENSMLSNFELQGIKDQE
jgi:hypothetical protein